MLNEKLSALLEEVAELLEVEGQVWEPRAYRRAARTIDGLGEDIAIIYREEGLKGLEELSGIGKNIARKIEEFIKTGSVKEFESIKASLPSVIPKLLSIPGLGPKKVKKLYMTLHLKSVDDLIRAGEAGKIAKIEGFGEKSQKEILASVSREKNRRYPFAEAQRMAAIVQKELQKIPTVKTVAIAGSLRRKKETIGDIDLLVTAKSASVVMKAMAKISVVDRVLASGSTKSTVLLKNGMQCDVRVVPEKSFGAALMYFTGSKEHNIELRRIAMKQKKKLSEYGLFSGEKFLAGRTEEEVYKSLGIQWVPPEARESGKKIKFIG